MRINLIFLFLFFTSSLTFSQEKYVDLSSPYSSIKTFLINLQFETYNDSLAALPFNPSVRSFRTAQESAVKLKRVLDGKGLFIYMDEIPKLTNYIDSISNKNKYILLENYPEIFILKAENGKWYFSDSSIKTIDELYEDTFIFGTGRLLNILPRLGIKKTFDLYTYQYIVIFILALISAIFYKFFLFITKKMFNRIIKHFGLPEKSSEKHLWTIAQPTSIVIILLLLIIFTPALQLPITYSKYVRIILKILLPLYGTIIAYRLVNIVSFFLSKMAQKTESTLDDQLVPMIRKILKAFVIIIGTLLILDQLAIPIVHLLTGLSIGGLAFALAAQDTLKNFFGSIMIFVDKPFQVGNWITTKDADGVVEEVGFRSSRIRTFRNSVIYIPNSKLADNNIDNHGLRKYRRFHTQISITYDTPPEMIEIYVKGLRQIVETHPHIWKKEYYVYLNEMAASSLNIMFYVFFDVPSWDRELECRHEVLMSIIKFGKERGVKFAFPTQTMHFQNDSSQSSSSYLSEQEAKSKLQDF